MTDITFADHGSIWVATGISDAGKTWLDENLDPDGQRWGPFDGRVIEPRYVGDIVNGAKAEDLVVGRA